MILPSVLEGPVPEHVTGQEFLQHLEATEMEEKVDGSGQDETIYRHVSSKCQTVTSEGFVPSGQGIVPEATFIPSNLRPLVFSKPNEGFRMGNYSLQTGEEFAVEFVKEASRFAMNNSQGRSGLAQLPVCKGDFYETNPYVYEDLTGILGIERMASGSNSDISMLTGKRANLSGFGSDCDPSYTESAEETQIFRSVNEGEFEFDKRLVASSCQAEFQHMPYYSTHQPYLSGPSDDSSSGKVKFMCSFGGKILPRPSDGKLRYVGGETRIITMNKDIGYEELMQKMKDNYGQALMLKYQLPDEDLDALVSVSSDEDLENMMEEYDRLRGGEGSSRLRVFLFTAVDIALTHFDSMTDRRKCEQRYVDAVNGIPETDSQRHADSTATAPSQYLENLIGLDDAENQNTTSETQEAVPTPLLLPQLSHDVAKVVHPPGIPPFSSKHTISTAASGTKSTASSPPLFPLPIHFKQPRIVDTPLHTLPDHLLQGDGHSSSSDCPVEFYHDLEYGGPISSSAASSQNEVHYKFRESRRAPDSPIKAQQDLLPLSYSDSMYHGELGFTDPLLPRVESHGKLNWLQEQFEDAQPMLNLRSDGELRPVDLHRIALQRVPPPVHQPTWKHNLDADQYSYQQTDYIQQTKSSGQPVQQQSMQTTHHNISQLPSHDAAVFRYTDQAQLHQDDAYGGPYMHKSVSTDQLGYSATAAAILQQAGLSPPSPPQVGKGQWHLQGHRPPNAPFVDQHHYRARVQHFNDEPSRAFYPATSPCNNEQLPEQVAYQQTFLHEQLSHPEEWFAHQQAIPFEQVCHQQALPHVHSDTVLQTHAMKPVNSMYEGIPLSQGHHSDGSLRARASYIGPSTSQEGLMPFQDCQEIGDVSNQVGQQGSQSEQIFSGQPVYTVPHVSSGSEEQPSVHTHFHESSDEIDSVLQQKTLKRDENKMHFVIGTRMDQSEVNNEEQSSELSRSNHSNPAVSYGGLDISEDSNTFLFPGSGDSYQASEKIEKVEPFGAISYQLKLPTAAGQTGAMGILSNALQSSELTGRISQVAAAWSESNAQELRTEYPPKEHVLGHCASNINSQLLTMDQMVIGDSLVEMGLNPHLPMAGAEPSIPSSNSEIWWGGMGLERDHDKVEASMYSLGHSRNSAEGLPQNTLNLIVSKETSRPVDSDRTIPLDEGSKILTSTPEHRCAQLLGESLIDDGDVEHSAYLLSDTLSNTRLVDELSCSSYVTMPVNMEEEGKYQKSDLLNCDVIKCLFPRPLTSVDDKAGNGHIDESSGKDISAHMKNRGVDSIQAICQDQSDEEVKGKSKVGENNAAAAVLRPNILPASTLSMSEWDQVTEDVRIEQNFCDRVTEVVDEETITAQDSDFEEAKIDDSDKDEPVSDAAIAECEAIAHGLQIIKNADLEELRELGSGTFGTVYHGKWRGSDVAIKRIKNSCFMGRPSEQERLRADFWREAWMLAHLHHPNVVAFYGVVPDGPGGTLATVTEYMVNGSLKQVLQRKDRSIDRRKRLLITMDAAFGMEYLHGKNIVHFDLKCENLLVNMRDPQRPICKVGDLGLSKIKHQTLVSGGVRGTLPWMAPELLNGSSSMVSEKVDVFSFGIVMWELLTGDEPYANMHYGAIIGGIVNNTLRPPIPNWCDPAWRLLMEQCWAADPAARPSFTEVANQLRAMATSLPLKGHSHQAQVHAHN